MEVAALMSKPHTDLIVVYDRGDMVGVLTKTDIVGRTARVASNLIRWVSVFFYPKSDVIKHHRRVEVDSMRINSRSCFFLAICSCPTPYVAIHSPMKFKCKVGRWQIYGISSSSAARPCRAFYDVIALGLVEVVSGCDPALLNVGTLIRR